MRSCDCVKGAHRQFFSAPNADRCRIRVLLSRASSFRSVTVCDISQSCLQADVLPSYERFYLYPPPRIDRTATTWDGQILEKPPKLDGRTMRFLYRRNRPLYMPNGVPLRRYVTLSSRLGMYKYHLHMGDLCFFILRDPVSCLITALILIHVDDVVKTGTAAEMAKLAEVLDTFAHGPIEYIRPDKPVAYCGLVIPMVLRKMHTAPMCRFFAQMSFSAPVRFIVPQRRRRTRKWVVFRGFNMAYPNSI